MMNLSLFISTYALIFLMELPDKTALSVIMLSAKHRSLAVFLGAASAFVVQCFVAVTFGSAVALLPERWTHVAAALIFLFFSYRLWKESRKKDEEAERTSNSFGTFWQAVWSSFVMIFVAEWGDLTQIATATLQAKYREPVTIFFASLLALWSVTLLSILAGRSLKRWLSPSKLQISGAVVFAAVGIYFLISAANVSWP